MSADVVAASHIMRAGFEVLSGHRTVLVRWLPLAKARAQALFVPAFGDEMNQMRRMVRLAAEALAGRGVAGCVFDLYGTGDTRASFAGATIDRWLDDIRTIAARIQANDDAPLLLIGCRLGATLAAHASHDLPRTPATLIGWAPVLQGKTQLSGLLRAAMLVRTQRSDSSEPDARTQWKAGRTALVGGYPVSPALAAQLDALGTAQAPLVGRASLFDVRLPVGEDAVVPTEALRRCAAAWTTDGVPTEASAIAGAAFWNVSEMIDVPELIDRTVAEVCGST